MKIKKGWADGFRNWRLRKSCKNEFGYPVGFWWWDWRINLLESWMYYLSGFGQRPAKIKWWTP